MEVNYSNKNDEMFEKSDDSDTDSEVDVFERHLSQNKIYDDNELFENYSTNSDHHFDHHLSFASSFCKNTQDQNENFLDDKFNGELLLDQFSEDKYIKCKYSEECHFDQSYKSKKNLFDSEPDTFLNNQEELKQNEERSSEDEMIVEDRKKHYLEFISTLPKICTPSVCGTMSQISDKKNKLLFGMNVKNEEAILEDENDSEMNVEENNFDWSIDQIATLNPIDIKFDEKRFLRYKSYELDEETQDKLAKENDDFFSQETIAPSPKSKSIIKNNDNLDSFEFSFIGHTNERISNIKHDQVFENKTPQVDSPSKFSIADPVQFSDIKKLEWSNFNKNLKHQTSTPCSSNKINNFKNQSLFNDSDQFLRRVSKSKFKANLTCDFENKSKLKQKKKLFQDTGFMSRGSINSMDDTSSNCFNTQNNEDYKTDDNDSFCFTQSSSASDNNILTPKINKYRSLIFPSIKEMDKLNSMNDENSSNKSNLENSIDNSDMTNNLKYWQNLTDSNCFVIKSLNNLFNNSDSGCYLNYKKKVLFN